MFAYLILFRYLCTCNYSYIMIGANYDIYMIVNFLTIIAIVVSGCYMLNKESKLLYACNDLIYYHIGYQGITPPDYSVKLPPVLIASTLNIASLSIVRQVCQVFLCLFHLVHSPVLDHH